MIDRLGTKPACFRGLAAVLLLALAAACARPEPPPPPPADGIALRAVSFAELPGWGEDDHTQALIAFRKSCARPAAKASGAKLALLPEDLAQACAAAARMGTRDRQAARLFFESYFKPVSIATLDGKSGLFTGYFEPQLEAALVPGPQHRYPLYRRPSGLEATPSTPFLTRSQIETGGLRNKGLELAWAADPLDLFELQIQGSGRLVLPDKRIMRVGFAGHNGHPYLAIGRVLQEYGAGPEDVTDWPAMKSWLRAHPDKAVEIMRRNDRYVFFQEVKGDGPVGAMGIPLTPNRSIAVDPTMLPYGAPVWVDTFNPGPRIATQGPPLRRLMVAQDTGGAIKGPVRGDIFFGFGDQAASLAGRMKSPGAWYVLMPTPAANRVVLTSERRR
ncbi:MAG: murein transglycosylase A [Reyranellaceae bacterium]